MWLDLHVVGPWIQYFPAHSNVYLPGYVDMKANPQEAPSTLSVKSVVKCAEGSVTPEERATAKRVTYGIIYGQTAFGLKGGLDIPQAEAQALISSFLQTFGGVRLPCMLVRSVWWEDIWRDLHAGLNLKHVVLHTTSYEVVWC
jgi:hypothetical protein